jgi:Uma2 family endonuclease
VGSVFPPGTTKEILYMSAVPKPYLTPQEYLARERRAETKSEYLRGEVFAMSGASRKHNLIATNVAGELRQRLRERPCEVYQGDMRVRVSPTGLYTYPDVTVVCGEPEFEDAEVDTLLNPKVLVEVLSPTTADYDRGGKFTHYRRLRSLHEYVLISQDRPLVEHYVRQGQDEWLLTEQSSLPDTLVLPSIQCQLPLSEIYLKVRFAPEEGEAPITNDEVSTDA